MYTPLMQACSDGDVENVIKLLQEYESTVNDTVIPNKLSPEFMNTLDNCNTALSYAILSDNFDVVEMLLPHITRLPVNLYNESILHLKMSGEMMEYLLRKIPGINLEYASTPGSTAMSVNIHRSSVNVIKVLYTHGAIISPSATSNNEDIKIIIYNYTRTRSLIELCERVLSQTRRNESINHILKNDENFRGVLSNHPDINIDDYISFRKLKIYSRRVCGYRNCKECIVVSRNN